MGSASFQDEECKRPFGWLILKFQKAVKSLGPE